MYVVTVTLSAQSRTAPNNMTSVAGSVVGLADDARREDCDAFGVAGEGRRTPSNVPSLGSAAMLEPTFADVDELVGPATPHFAYQLRARVRELVLDLPDEHPVRRHAEEKLELLDRLGP